MENNINKNQNQNQSKFGAGAETEKRQAGIENQKDYKGSVGQSQRADRTEDQDLDEEETGSQGVQPRSDKAGQPSSNPNRNQR